MLADIIQCIQDTPGISYIPARDLILACDGKELRQLLNDGLQTLAQQTDIPWQTDPTDRVVSSLFSLFERVLDNTNDYIN